MKKFLLLILTAALVCCGKNDDQENKKENVPDNTYVGTVSVVFRGNTVDNPDITVKLEPSEDGTTATLTIYQIQFVPEMGVAIDVVVPDLQLVQGPDGTTITGDEIIPLTFVGVEYPSYKVQDFSGTLKDKHLSFSLLFGGIPTSFEGVLSK